MPSDAESKLDRLLNGPLSFCNTLAGGALGSGLCKFLVDYSHYGWDTASAMLEPALAVPMLGLAAIFGVTKLSENEDKRREARELAERLQPLAEDEKSAADFLRKITRGEIELKVELDLPEPDRLANAVVESLKAAGFVRKEHLEDLRAAILDSQADVRVYLNTLDLAMRDVIANARLLPEIANKLERIEQRGVDLPQVVPASNFINAQITQNRDFVGREDLLEQLHAKLCAGGVAVRPDSPIDDSDSQAVSGEGGVGKTELAVEYAYRYAAQYAGRWWLDASTTGLEKSADALARVLGIAVGPKTTPEQIAAAIRTRLSAANHLLILDNLEDAARLNRFLLAPPARVLVTTRLHTLPTADIGEMEISVFHRSESVALLCKHRPDLDDDQHRAELGAVAERLGDHALSVTLAASYLRRHVHVTPAELLERLQNARLGDPEHLFERLDPKQHAHGYALNVADSFSLHLPEFADTPALDILALAALCHPSDIPLDLFYDALPLPRADVDHWLDKLAGVSIVRYGQTVQIHRLMQEVVLVAVGAERERQALKLLVDLLRRRFAEPDDYREWTNQRRYALHAEAAVARAQRLGELENVAILANQLGYYLRQQARLDDALRLYRSAERIDRAAFGDDHPNVAIRVNNIGAALFSQGDLAGALNCYREAERIDRAAFGDDHPNVAIGVNNIGFVLKSQGDLEGALNCYREAERIDRAAFGDEHPNVARNVNNIGGVLVSQGDLAGALNCYREAERIDRAAFGDDHPEVATDVNNIGAVLDSQGDLAGALKYYREAERIDRAAFGDDHPSVARDVNNIGLVLDKQGDVVGAAGHVTTAFLIFLRSFGPRSLQTLQLARNLIALKRDPIAVARSECGDALADELRRALEQ